MRQLESYFLFLIGAIRFFIFLVGHVDQMGYGLYPGTRLGAKSLKLIEGPSMLLLRDVWSLLG
jgi:hypothetical protein